MSHFREILIKLSPKYIPCSLKRCNIHVCILNGYKVYHFDTLRALFAQQQSNEPHRDKTNKMAYAPSKDSDHLGSRPVWKKIIVTPDCFAPYFVSVVTKKYWSICLETGFISEELSMKNLVVVAAAEE